jgi:predicted ArsR family transcriptional regulator
MVDDSRAACRMELQMMSAVMDHPVQLTACRLDGCQCCQFELAAAPAGKDESDDAPRK